MPAEKELARQIIIVIGAGSVIGKETAHRRQWPSGLLIPWEKSEVREKYLGSGLSED
jgi:hypothetical protein